MKIYKKRCKNCLFSDNKIVSDERKAELLNEIAKEESYFVCHIASINNKDIACRGFIDVHGEDSKLYAFAKFLGCIEEHEQPDIDSELSPYKDL